MSIKLVLPEASARRAEARTERDGLGYLSVAASVLMSLWGNGRLDYAASSRIYGLMTEPEPAATHGRTLHLKVPARIVRRAVQRWEAERPVEGPAPPRGNSRRVARVLLLAYADVKIGISIT